MRVEDLDPGRVRPEYLTTQLEDLRWLGLDWDEGPDVGGEFGPYLQSERRGSYEEALSRLARKGLLFECFCSRSEIAAAASAPHGDEDEGPVYPGTCRKLSKRERERLRASRGSALRFVVPDEVVGFEDEVAGTQRREPEAETGAFVVRRKDGVAAYQLAVVVDDATMEITHVLRGADLLGSTARQILLYRALDLDPPRWAHVPLILGPDGERLAKRHGAVSLQELRRKGVDSEQVVGWLAWTCGLAEPGELVRPADLVADFSLDRIPRQPIIATELPWDPQ